MEMAASPLCQLLGCSESSQVTPPVEVQVRGEAYVDPLGVMFGPYRHDGVMNGQPLYWRGDERSMLYWFLECCGGATRRSCADRSSPLGCWMLGQTHRPTDYFMAALLDGVWVTMDMNANKLAPIAIQVVTSIVTPTSSIARVSSTPGATLAMTPVELRQTFNTTCRALGSAVCDRRGHRFEIRGAWFHKDVSLAWKLSKRWYAAHRCSLIGLDRDLFSAVRLGTNALMCAIPKNGCSRWRRLAIRALGLPHWRGRFLEQVHDPKLNGLTYVSSMSIHNAQEELMNRPAVFKFIITRSPVTRTLSAFLSSRRTRNGRVRWRTFAEFIRWLASNTSEAFKDPHVRPQSRFCDIQNGAHFDFVGRVEERSTWASKLLSIVDFSVGGEDVLSSGWGGGGSAFISAEADAESGNFVVEPQTNNPDMLWSAQSTAADSLVCEHYDPHSFAVVANVYQEDFAYFRYHEDLQRWRRRCQSSKLIGESGVHYDSMPEQPGWSLD